MAGCVNVGTYLGFGLLSACALIFEILLTRVFSATLYYHFAFIAVAVAMFGMSAGALLVYLFPILFKPESVQNRIYQSTLSFSISSVMALIVYSQCKFPMQFDHTGLLSMAELYLLFSWPFVFVGVATTLLLTRFHPLTGKLYACDLLGAAAGCILVILLLYNFDPIGCVLILGLLAALAAALFSHSIPRSRALFYCTLIGITFATAAVLQEQSYKKGESIVRFVYAKGKIRDKPIYEIWNPYSWIRVDKFFSQPTGWGLSSRTPPHPGIEQLSLQIDSGAGTIITKFNGEFNNIQYLKFDVVNFVQFLKPNSDILVIGVGGGRDLLSALVFKQKSVLGVEINNSILELMRGPLCAFSGNLAGMNLVQLVNDEARSYISRSNNKWDIIEASLIDTWAASSAGAFALSENSLYTVEGWSRFLQHLKPGGVLSFSRWYDSKDSPVEFYRLCSLGAEALRRESVSNPRLHMLAIVNESTSDVPVANVGTLLISKAAFSAEELDNAERFADALNFKIVLSPRVCTDPVLLQISQAKYPETFFKEYPSDLTPPSDNCPFFFNFRKFQINSDIFSKRDNPIDGVQILQLACLTTTALALMVLVLPFFKLLARNNSSSKISNLIPALLFFSSIGLGFIMVELSVMQRLSILLGQPILSLSAVLFSFLIGGGCGSLLSSFIKKENKSRYIRIFLLTLSLIILLLAGVLPQICLQFESGEVWLRILLAVCISIVPAIFMGTIFPLGMDLFQESGYAEESACFWALNGACSVFATVLSSAVSLVFGLQAALLFGLCCYLLALGSIHIFLIRTTPK